MRSSGLMKLGALCGAGTAIVALFGDQYAITVTMVAFGAGALFGKGYGIWEERERQAARAEE